MEVFFSVHQTTSTVSILPLMSSAVTTKAYLAYITVNYNKNKT